MIRGFWKVCSELVAYCRCNADFASPREHEPGPTLRSQPSKWRPGQGSGREDSLGQPRGVLRMGLGAPLVVQWLRITLQCRGCGFNPWFRGTKIPHVSEQWSLPAKMTRAPEPHPESSCTPPKPPGHREGAQGSRVPSADGPLWRCHD